MGQQSLNLSCEMNIQVESEIYYRKEKRKIGTLTQLALTRGKKELTITHIKESLFRAIYGDIIFLPFSNSILNIMSP